MKKFIGMVVAAAALMLSIEARAATVDLTFTKQADGTTWQLTMDVAAGGALTSVTQIAFAIVSTPVTDFTILATGSIDPFGGFSTKSATGNTLHVLLGGLAADPTGTIATAPSHLVVGNLINGGGLHACDSVTGPSCDSQFTRGDATGDGGTILDTNFSGIAESEVNIHFVPEPGAMLLLGIGIAGLSLVRRKA